MVFALDLRFRKKPKSVRRLIIPMPPFGARRRTPSGPKAAFQVAFFEVIFGSFLTSVLKGSVGVPVISVCSVSSHSPNSTIAASYCFWNASRVSFISFPRAGVAVSSGAAASSGSSSFVFIRVY